MALLIENNAYSRVAASLAAGGTTLTVDTGTGDRFPIAGSGNYFKLTLQDAANNIEIIKVTARAASSDSMTIQRAQEGTTARAWSIGDIVELRLTAGVTAPLQVLEEADTAPLIRGKIDVPTRTGGDASGSWNINSATATALQTARTINGVSFNGTANITITANTPNSLTFNNTGAGGASGSLFNGAGALTVSYNTVGAPSTTGANASGTWGINITGNAATATTATNQSGGTVNATSIAGTSVNVAANGAAADPHGASAVTNPANANNYSYFGLTRAGQIGLGVGITGTTGALGLGPNAFILGSGTSGAAGTVSSPWIAFNGTNFVASGSITANGQFNGSAAGLTGTAGINITGNAETVTNGVYNDGATYGISISGNAATASDSTRAFNYTQSFSGDWNSDFQNAPAGSSILRGDLNGGINNPGGTWWFQHNYRHNNSSNFWGVQVAWGWEDNANRLRTRNVQAGSYGAWVDYLNSSNFNSYAPTLTGGGASGTWNIAITGNAGSAYGLATQGDASPPSGRQVLSSGSDGYAWLGYINSNTANAENPAISQILTTNGDNFYRKSSLAHVGNQFNAAGYKFVEPTPGSPAYYGARAWATFDSIPTTVILASANVSSITDHALGEQTINFSTAMPDANYVTVCGIQDTGAAATYMSYVSNTTGQTTTGVRTKTSAQVGGSSQLTDVDLGSVVIFR